MVPLFLHVLCLKLVLLLAGGRQEVSIKVLSPKEDAHTGEASSSHKACCIQGRIKSHSWSLWGSIVRLYFIACACLSRLHRLAPGEFCRCILRPRLIGRRSMTMTLLEGQMVWQCEPADVATSAAPRVAFQESWLAGKKTRFGDNRTCFGEIVCKSFSPVGNFWKAYCQL